MVLEFFNFLVGLLMENPAAFVALIVGAIGGLCIPWFRGWLRFKDPTKKLKETMQALEDAQAEIKALTESEQHKSNQLRASQDEVAKHEALLQLIHEEDVSVWSQPIRNDETNVPKFIHRTQRKPLIISVFNLKGGVGKTTITGNLGALWGQSSKALLIDLDYQQSLSIACLEDRIGDIDEQERGVERLWRQQNRLDSLHELWLGVEGIPNIRVVAAGGKLSHAEASCMLRWLARQTKDDVRFRLRQALHHENVNFDVVLIDCPPRLTTAGINALAASDFVLIPTLPDSRSGEAAIRVIKEIDHLKRSVSPEFSNLRVLGVLCNRTTPAHPAIEQREWGNICASAKHQDVYSFSARLRQFTAPGRAEQFQSLHPDHRAEYESLLDEIKSRIE